MTPEEKKWISETKKVSWYELRLGALHGVGMPMPIAYKIDCMRSSDDKKSMARIYRKYRERAHIYLAKVARNQFNFAER